MKNSKRKGFYLFFVFFGFCATACVGFHFFKHAPTIKHPLIQLLHGREWLLEASQTVDLELSNLPQIPVVIHFLSPQDPASQHVIDIINQTTASINNRCFQYGIIVPEKSYDHSPEGTRAFIDEHRPQFPCTIDVQNNLKHHFPILKIPSSLLYLPEQETPIIFDTITDYNTMLQKLLALLNNYSPLPPQTISFQEYQQQTELSFPTKIEAIKNYRGTPALAISDTGHHRILIVSSTDGTILDQIGTGVQGFVDGQFEQASFNRPHGIVYDDVSNRLFIADRYNHALRIVDCTQRTVTTAVGTGAWGSSHLISTGMIPLQTDLSSPYDVSFFLRRDFIMITQATSHTIWGYETLNNRLRPVVGNGINKVTIGLPPYHSLMFPAGICLRRGELFAVDAAASTLYSFKNLDITILIGSTDMVSGLCDGDASVAQLKNPHGIATNQKDLFIADTFNHTIRVYNVENKLLTTLCSTSGLPGTELGNMRSTQFNAPKGIAHLNNCLYVADTNNHRIVVLNLETDTASRLDIKPHH